MAEMALRISDDRLQASLRIPAGVEPELRLVHDLVNAQQVRYGLLLDVLKGLRKDDEVDQDVIIARGRPPAAARAGTITSELPVGKQDVVVKQDQDIGAWVPPVPAQDGTAVDGEPIAVSEQDRQHQHQHRPAVGPGLKVTGNRVIVQYEGFLARDREGLWFVALAHCPCRRVAKPDVVIDSEGLTCSLNLEAGEFVLGEDLKRSLEAAQVSFGLQVEAIKQAYRPIREARTLVLARGIPVQVGADASIEMLIDDRAQFTVHEDGSMDFRDAHTLKEVVPDRALARCHPEEAGQPGMSVRGVELPAVAGKSMSFSSMIGDGARFSAEDGLLIVADREGIFVREPNGKVTVVDVITIDGDVDLEVGNIESRFPVVITGDIKAGFTVKSTGDITVRGVIEDARVSAQGNLSVGRGILPGDHRVKAHGDITALYVSGRTIKTRNLLVAQDIRHSQVACSGFLQARGVIGGLTTVAQHVAVEHIGTPQEEPTELIIGVHHHQQALLDEAVAGAEALEAAVAEVEEQHQRLQTDFQDITKKLRRAQGDKGINPDIVQRYRQEARRLLEASKQSSATLKEQRRELQGLQGHIKDMRDQAEVLQRKAWVEVTQIAYPRVRVSFGPDMIRLLREPIRATVLRLLDGAITET